MSTERFPSAKAIRSTGTSLLVSTPKHGEMMVPQKAIHDDSEVWNCTNGSEGTLVVHAWWWELREKERTAADRRKQANERAAALTARSGGRRG